MTGVPLKNLPCQEWQTRRVWSLWDMLKANGKSFVDSLEALGSIEAALQGAVDPLKPPHAQDRQRLLALLDRFDGQVKVLGARLTSMQLDRLVEALQGNTISWKGIVEHIEHIRSRMSDELSLINLYVMDPSRAAYYAPAEPRFGDEIDAKFKSANADVEGAGRCLAVGEATACVLHLMRVMECGLKALARALKIPYAPSWESYLKQISDKIALPRKKKGKAWIKKEVYFRDLSGDLVSVKQAWRNPTMHADRRYDIEQAEEIYRAVRTFMKRVASRMDEAGKFS